MSIDNLIKNLRIRRFKAEFFVDRDELFKYIMKEINEDEKIGFGGSKTLDDLGLYEKFIDQGKEVFWHWKTEPNERLEVLKKAQHVDSYFSSTNAITLDGRLVNIDGNANRVASMIFGPKKVFIIAGENKIANDLDSALNRIKIIACPQNARRLERNLPCAVTGQCTDCRSDERMCNVTTIIEGNIPTTDIRICIVGENLGY